MTNTIDELKECVENAQYEVSVYTEHIEYYARLLAVARQRLASREKDLQAAVKRQYIKEGGE